MDVPVEIPVTSPLTTSPRQWKKQCCLSCLHLILMLLGSIFIAHGNTSQKVYFKKASYLVPRGYQKSIRNVYIWNEENLKIRNMKFSILVWNCKPTLLAAGRTIDRRAEKQTF
jgi:hypothetical protein